jgi:hypothetical protein
MTPATSRRRFHFGNKRKLIVTMDVETCKYPPVAPIGGTAENGRE